MIYVVQSDVPGNRNQVNGKGKMIKRFLNLFFVLLIVSLNSCMENIDLNDKDQVKGHLKKYTFENIDWKNNMTSFIEFNDSYCELSVYIQGDFFTKKKYKYSLGDTDSRGIRIIIEGNEGKWRLREGGDLVMYNKNESFIYLHKDLSN